MLIGAYKIDEHFKNTPFEKNAPVILALIGIWYNNFFNAESEVLLPYYSIFRQIRYLICNKQLWKVMVKV